jgi:acetylornithine deacetylase/succinyl-diaminopimelate desuccinylase-like protein
MTIVDSSKARNPSFYAEGWARRTHSSLYSHYACAADPLTSGAPFEPAVRGDDIFARGACDDKGQVYIQIKAVEGLLKTTGKLPVNVKFLLEGEEETGGEHIEEYVKTRPPRLRADAAVICDTEMFAPELPTICVGLRGIVYYELFVEGDLGCFTMELIDGRDFVSHVAQLRNRNAELDEESARYILAGKHLPGQEAGAGSRTGSHVARPSSRSRGRWWCPERLVPQL